MIRQKLLIFILFFSLFLPVSYVFAGTILSSYKYAWSNNVGYINFENVIVSDSALSGYAWSTNYGLINFNPAQGGVHNDGLGNLSGYAWGEQLGWIDFDNVSIDPSTGKLSGTASGTLVGTITFDCTHCDVRTDWRKTTASAGASNTGSGGNGPVFNPTRVVVSVPNVTTPTVIQIPKLPITGITNTKNSGKVATNKSSVLDKKSLSGKSSVEPAQQNASTSLPQLVVRSTVAKIIGLPKIFFRTFVSFFEKFFRFIKIIK